MQALFEFIAHIAPMCTATDVRSPEKSAEKASEKRGFAMTRVGVGARWFDILLIVPRRWGLRIATPTLRRRFAIPMKKIHHDKRKCDII